MALILVVDDEPDVRAALREILEDDGHRVVEAEDGDQVMDLTLAHWPDVVLLDVMMPRVSGWEALAAIRSNPSAKDMPVILVTAAGRPEDARRARSLGVREYISKPWAEGEVEMRVKWTLSRAAKPKRDPVERILVVDDEEHVRLALAALLEDAGYAAVTAGDGAAALSMAAEHLPDLILMDVRMPGMSGLEALQALHSQRRTRGIPVIMVTVAASQAEVSAALAFGASDYVLKPWHPRDLERRIRRALDAAAARRLLTSGLRPTGTR